MYLSITEHPFLRLRPREKPERRRTRPAIIPRGLRLDDAAAYLRISRTKFLDWVERGLMPQAKRIDGVVVWDRVEIDLAFEELSSETQNPWD